MAFARTATLRVSDQSYDLIYFRYGFGRGTDKKGRPTTGIQGGYIQLVMESTKSTELLELFFNTDPEYPTDHRPRVISGSVEVCDPEDGLVIRRLMFEEAFIVRSSEEMHTDSPLPMMETITISPLRLDIDRTIRLDRRWPQAPYGWQEYVQEEPIAAMTKESEPAFTIIDAYWIDENGNEIRRFDVAQPVTLYVHVKEREAVGRRIYLNFEDKEDGKTVRLLCSGIVDPEQIITIDNFKLKPVK